jgi:hypothetical protein
MNYELKDKITVSKELLNELEMKSWQEIEHIQAQISNLAECAENNNLRKALKNLLTSYYVFAGNIEILLEEDIINDALPEELEQEMSQEVQPEEVASEPKVDMAANFSIEDTIDTNEYEVSDPFEYFVDFDDPVGEPLTDEDLYNS